MTIEFDNYLTWHVATLGKTNLFAEYVNKKIAVTDLTTYTPLKNFLQIQNTTVLIDDISTEIIQCSREYSVQTPHIELQRTEIFSSLNTPVITTQPSGQDTGVDFLLPRQQNGEAISFEDAQTSLMLTFMTMLYEADNRSRPAALNDTTLAIRLAYNLRSLAPLGDLECHILETIIARAVCRYYYRYVVIYEKKQADFHFSTNPYACALVGGAIIPSVLLAIPFIANFITSVSVPLQMVFPAALLVLGFLLGQFPSRNHQQDLDVYRIPTREQQSKAKAEWMLGCAASIGTIAQMLNPPLIQSLIASAIADGMLAQITTLLLPVGASLATLAIIYFIIQELQRQGHVSQSPCFTMIESMTTCVRSLFRCGAHGDYAVIP